MGQRLSSFACTGRCMISNFLVEQTSQRMPGVAGASEKQLQTPLENPSTIHHRALQRAAQALTGFTGASRSATHRPSLHPPSSSLLQLRTQGPEDASATGAGGLRQPVEITTLRLDRVWLLSLGPLALSGSGTAHLRYRAGSSASPPASSSLPREKKNNHNIPLPSETIKARPDTKRALCRILRITLSSLILACDF